MSWRPELPSGGSIHLRLAEALQRDVNAGVLKPGDRLPPQRILAERLRMSVGTVTKAFQEAERRGLVSGQVGRGTFIAGTDGKAGQSAGPSQSARIIDLSVNVTPFEAAASRFAHTLRRLAGRANMLDMLRYSPPAGSDAHRKAAAVWLARTAAYPSINSANLIVTAGGQQAMALACAVLCRPGDTILCEAATYYGMRALADHAGYRLHGVAMDADGILPASLDKAAVQTGARVAYLMPTVQVPTGRSMSAARRTEIVLVARKRKLHIIEDDNYALFAPRKPGIVPLAHLAPDLCFYTASVSKSLAPGLRTGFLTAPNQDYFDQIVQALRATVYANAGLGPLIMAQWVEDGSAFEIAESMVREVTARWKMALAELDPAGIAHLPLSPHLWLKLDELETERTAGRAQRAGVTVTPPELPLLDRSLISGLRICIGAPKTRADLSLGLSRLRGALTRAPEIPSSALI